MIYDIEWPPPPTIWWISILLAWLLYFLGLSLHRLYFSPLSHIPGPRLAALTSWYEAYYEIVLGGQYSFQIDKLHDKYGKSFGLLSLFSPLSCKQATDNSMTRFHYTRCARRDPHPRLEFLRSTIYKQYEHRKAWLGCQIRQSIICLHNGGCYSTSKATGGSQSNVLLLCHSYPVFCPFLHQGTAIS